MESITPRECVARINFANIRVHNVQYGIANRSDSMDGGYRFVFYGKILGSRYCTAREVKQLGLRRMRSTRRAKLRQGVRIEFSLTVVQAKLSELLGFETAAVSSRSFA